MIRPLGVFLLLAIALTGCAGTPQQQEAKITHDFNPRADFRLFKTYRWFDGPYFDGDPATEPESQYNMVRDMMNTVMNERGYEWVQFFKTDLVLHIHSGRDVKPAFEDWITYNWYKPWWGAYGPMVEISRYAPRTLVLDIIDAKKTELVWRGLVPDFYDGSGGIADPGRIAEQVQSLLKDFPERIR